MTGCFACKTKRKKCDETKPQCLRCLKAHTECPGYIYLEDPVKTGRKLRTLPAPRTRIGDLQVTAYPGISLAFLETEESKPRPPNQLLLENDAIPSPALYDVSSTPVRETARTLAEATDISDWRQSSSSSSGLLERPSGGLSTSHWLALDAADSDPLTTGQASLLEALFSLGQPSGLNSPLQRPQPSAYLLPDPSAALISNLLASDPEGQDSEETLEDDVHIVYHQPALDRTLESNALQFVLQGYATWIHRLALEPLHLMHTARDVVFSHFAGGKQSRLIIALLANAGNKIGNVELVEASPNPLVIMLQNAVRQHLGAVVSHSNSQRHVLIRALDSVVETMSIHVFISPMSEVMILRQEAAPIFRQLCPDPPGAPINLTSLLQSPLGSLRYYAGVDLTLCLLTDMPTIFHYQVSIPGSRPFGPVQLGPGIQGDDPIQWLNGTPNQVLLLFAEMITMRSHNFGPDVQSIASLERGIRGMQPYSGLSSDRFLAIIRSVLQECWKQAAFVYLYMAVCRDACDTPRVKEAFRRVMKLLNGTKPGRLPDEFMIAPLMIVCPAAHRKCDREVLKQRILGLHLRSQKFRGNTNAISIVEDYWARADAQGRPTMWSDVAVSRRHMLGV